MELEIIDGHGIGFITGTKRLNKDEQRVRMDIFNYKSTTAVKATMNITSIKMKAVLT